MSRSAEQDVLLQTDFSDLELYASGKVRDVYRCDNEHLLFVAIQEYLLTQLELPYQVIQKCTADIGKPNARGIDMEAWLPGQGKYRETHTADYMTDYQARRLKTRVRRSSGELELIHTNDATAFALGRIMIALIENGQDEQGNIRMPVALQPYLGGRQVL